MNEPLAARLRPNNLSEVIGQKHLINDDSFLVNSIKLKKSIPNQLLSQLSALILHNAEIYLSLTNGIKLKYYAVTKRTAVICHFDILKCVRME